MRLHLCFCLIIEEISRSWIAKAEGKYVHVQFGGQKAMSFCQPFLAPFPFVPHRECLEQGPASKM